MMLPQNPDQASLADAADLAALLDLVLDENALCDRFADATAGDAITYHIGMLARDRDKVATKLLPERRDELELVARRAFAMAEAGLCHLLQRRMDTECFAYILVVRPRSTNSRGMASAALLQKLQRGIA
ncbi:MAG: hypothetical protein INF89_19660 [Roseomonas sp.]|nr:hypothetical protein [Roseomonas sp.]